MKRIVFMMVCLQIVLSINSQTVLLEKTYQIPGKADVGDVAFINYNQSTGESVVYFTIPEKSKTINVESYYFDKNFDFIKKESAVNDLETTAKSFPWFNYQGDEYDVQRTVIKEDDNLVLIKQKIIYTYEWKKMKYSSKTKVLDDIKFKDKGDEKLIHLRNWISEEDQGNSYVLCYRKPKGDKSPLTAMHLLKINNSTDQLEKDLEIKFNCPQEIAFPKFNDSKTEGRGWELNGDIILITAPSNDEIKNPVMKSNEYTYIRIAPDLTVKDQINFSSPSSFWSIEDAVTDEKTNSVFIFGASLLSSNKYYNQLSDTKKFDGFQIIKISEGKVAFLKSISGDDISNKVVMAPSQKKATEYQGKKFFISGYTVTEEGNLVVTGQSWFTDVVGTLSNINNGGIGSSARKITYSDCFTFGFDNQGNIIGEYLYDTKGFMGGNNLSAYQYLFKGKDPKNVYWFVFQPVYWNWDLTTSVYNYRPIKQPPLSGIKFGITKFKCDITSSGLGKIDLKSNSLSDFANYQLDKESKKFYYLCPGLPFLITDDKQLLLFGSQSKSGGKTIWFLKLSLD